MVGLSDAILMELTEAEIKSVIAVVLEKLTISKIDNLRRRHQNIQFDCLLRGYIGEYSITKWLNSFDIILDKTNYLADGEQIDVDFLYKGKNLELKTSLVPDVDLTLEKAISVRDIKLIVRGDAKIDNLQGDAHLQIMFDQKRKAKDIWLENQLVDLERQDVDDLYVKMGARKYRDTVYFVGWIDKPSLIHQIYNRPENSRTWTFANSARSFWNCKISEAHPPITLISYLKDL